ncbi:ANTAR domain-containing protein [Streptomyces sp. NPDC048172]|uniref:ANTAR domain-containing protein n=1 Tax=Streptomyces sp. NPDC048172 TaxID=3365505 RepID=UPI0037171AC3
MPEGWDGQVGQAGRTGRVMERVALEARRRGGQADVRDVCAAAVDTLPVDGAGISLMSTPAMRHVLHTTDRISGELEELQLTLGEGPCVDVISSGAPVLTGDLSRAELRERWPSFAPAAHAAGAGAFFALPLSAGTRSPGVLDLYAARTGPLRGEVLADALAFAEAATMLLLLASPGIGTVQGAGPEGMEEALGYDQYRAEIDQAVGMLTEQMSAGVEEVAVRLRAYAYAQARTLADVAVEVVARRLRFGPDGTARCEGQ